MYNDTDDCCLINCAYAHACDTDCESECAYETDAMLIHDDSDHDCHHHYCKPSDIFANNCKKQTLGMAYVPAQRWHTTFDYETGFMKGTIFPELYMPFGKEGGCHHE